MHSAKVSALVQMHFYYHRGVLKICMLFCMIKLRSKCDKTVHLAPIRIKNCFIDAGCFQDNVFTGKKKSKA